MAGSFSLSSALPQLPVHGRVLVTGAAGRIGRGFARTFADRYALRLTDLPEADPAPLAGFGEYVPARLDDRSQVKELVDGVDTVLHLAGRPSPATPWEELLPHNVVATYNVLQAAADAGCRRAVYASSIHAVAGYPDGRQVGEDDPVNPDSLYGVSKCFGEALGRYLAEQRGLSVVALRIGGFRPIEEARSPGYEWLARKHIAPSDLYQLIRRAIEVDGLRFAVVHAVGANETNDLDDTRARELLGYAPEYGWVDGTVRRVTPDGA